MHPYRATQISEHVWWVGAIDWNIRDFHGYLDQPRHHLQRLPGHGREDHADRHREGAVLRRAARPHRLGRRPGRDQLHRLQPRRDGPLRRPAGRHRAVQPEKVFASQLGAKALAEHFHLPHADHAGEGRRDARPGEPQAGLRRDPDGALARQHGLAGCPSDDVLFSQDGFGMHLASQRALRRRARPVGHRVRGGRTTRTSCCRSPRSSPRCIEPPRRRSASPRRSSPRTTARSGGGTSAGSSAGTPPGRASRSARKAVVVYDTMWHSTALMAHAIADGLEAGGASVKLMPLKANHRSDVAARAARRRRAARRLADAQQQHLPDARRLADLPEGAQAAAPDRRRLRLLRLERRGGRADQGVPRGDEGGAGPRGAAPAASSPTRSASASAPRSAGRRRRSSSPGSVRPPRGGRWPPPLRRARGLKSQPPPRPGSRGRPTRR